MTRIHSFFPAVFTAFLALLWSQASAMAAGWTTQAISDGPLVVSSIHLRAWKQGVLVSGIVARRSGYDYRADANCRLKIDVLDARGHIMRSVFTSYLQRPVFNTYRGIPGRSTYAAYLATMPPTGGRVRVACKLASLESREPGSRPVV